MIGKAELKPLVDLSPVRIKLYPIESRLLREYLLNIHLNVHSLKGGVPDNHIVISEWFMTKFISRSVRIEMGASKTAKAVEIPISVSRILMREMTTNPLPIALNLILGQIHQQLCNRDFLPL